MKYLFLFLLATTVAFSQIPQRIAFQGVLTDASGNVRNVSSPVVITFSLWDDANDNNISHYLGWTETNPSVVVTRGMFSHELGSITPFPKTVGFDKQYYLQISEQGQAVLKPRIKLTASAYAMRAVVADVADTARWAPSISTLTQLMRNEIATMIKDSLVSFAVPNDVPLGTILPFYGEPSQLPSNGKWLVCDSSTFVAANYPDLRDHLIALGFPANRTPDLRGMFLRGANLTKATSLGDPDYATRTGGSASNRIGSVQASQSVNQTLRYDGKTTYLSLTMGIYNQSSDGYFDLATRAVQQTNSLETRPKNVYVNYIIRAKP